MVLPTTAMNTPLLSSLPSSLYRLAPLLGLSAGMYGASLLEFVDLRAQAGLAQSAGAGGAVTLMCGNIGAKSTGEEMQEDLGIVLGLRAGARRLKLDNDDETLPANEAFAGVVGGLGYYIDKRTHLEICAGYTWGRATLTDLHGGFSDQDGDTTTWSGEVGWFYTWKAGWQFGVVGGWSSTRATCLADTPAEFKATSYGVDLAGSLGYRF